MVVTESLKVEVKVKPHNIEGITVERCGDAICIFGDTFKYESVNGLSRYVFLGNMKSRRVIRDNIKAINGIIT